jgi:hypothetical protein
MTTTTTEVRPGRARPLQLSWIAPAVLVLAALVLVVQLSRSMPAREDVTIVNRSGAAVTLDATDQSHDGWVGVGTVDPHDRVTAQEVIDQGGVWIFRLTVGPDRLGEIRRTDAQLQAAHWTLTIPSDAADGLPADRRAG